MTISASQAKAIRNNPEEIRKIEYRQAIKAEQKANKNTWNSCLWCWTVFKKYKDIGVKGLADDMGKSDDTVYDRAHAYDMFIELCNYDDGTHRFFVHTVRRLPYVYWSHFRAIYDAKKDFGLTTNQAFDLLMEIYQAEGGLSSRNLSNIVTGKMGINHPWTYYAEKTIKEMEKTIDQPNTPRAIRSQMKKMVLTLKKKVKK